MFLAYVCFSFVAVLMAAPLLMAVEPASGGGSRERPVTFGWTDRNGDGFVDAQEARAIPGLAAALEPADANGDGRLDQVEFARALGNIRRK